MQIKFEYADIYKKPPMDTAHEIINEMCRCTHRPLCDEIDAMGKLQACKVIEFMELWRKQNQPLFEKILEENHVQ